MSFLSGNQLKIIALAAMTSDHVGKQFFPETEIFSIIGRIAFPIFAYMISEGCRYTKNKTKHLLTMLFMAVLCQSVFYIATGSLYQCILVTFSLSVSLIYSADYAVRKKNLPGICLLIVVFSGIFFVSRTLPSLLPDTDFYIDYGLWGIMLPVLIYFAEGKMHKLIISSLGLCLVAFDSTAIQWYSLVALPLLAMYSEKRGKLNIKYLFYIYYPLHMAAIYIISIILQ